MTGNAGQYGTAEPGAWFAGVTSLLGSLTPNGGLKKIPEAKAICLNRRKRCY
jgi:hypothetical protein